MNIFHDRIEILRKIMPYVNNYKIQWIVLFLLKILQKVPTLLQPFLLKFFIDVVLNEKKRSYLYMVIGLYMGLFLLETLLKVGHRVIDNVLFNKITRVLREKVWRQYMSIPMDKINRYRSNDLVNRLNLDIDMVKYFLIGEVFDYITALISIFVSVSILFSLNWQFACAACLLAPFTLFLAHPFEGKMEVLSKTDRNSMNEMEETIQQLFGNWKEIKANQLENVEEKQFKGILCNLCSGRIEKENLLLKKATVLDVKEKLMDTLCLYIVGGVLHSVFNVTAGALIACIGYYENIICGFRDILEMDTNLEWVNPSIQRVIEILQFPLTAKIEKKVRKNSNIEYEIKNVGFQYNEYSKEVLKKLNLKIKRRDKILIDGISGSGKSTLLKLLSGELYQKQGDIIFEGCKLSEFPMENLFEYIRKLDQDTYFMDISVKEFLKMAKEDSDINEMRQACKAVNLWEDLQRIDPELNFCIGENGSKLSGGQKQKLALARLFLTNNKTLLLDEAFSAIDVKDKLSIMQRLLERYSDSTIICVAHDIELQHMFTSINITDLQ